MTPGTGADPRLHEDAVRRCTGDGTEGTVYLVGVVHDHPASVHRVRSVVTEVDPDVLALELAPLALPLFEQYAEDSRTPPVFGGEMSAAIQATSADRVVGIDGPSRGFLRRLAGACYREQPTLSTVRTLGRRLWSASRRTLLCRAGATVASRTGVRLEVDSPIPHDVDRHAAPAQQAEDERQQLRSARSALSVLGSTQSVQFRDDLREAHMADRLTALRREGVVVAVVGYDHLAPLTERLRG